MVLLNIVVLWTILLTPYTAFLLKISTVRLIIHSSCSCFMHSSLKLLISYVHLYWTWAILLKLIVLYITSISKLAIKIILRRLSGLSSDCTSKPHHHFKKRFGLLTFYLLHLDLFICESRTILNITTFYWLVIWIILKLLVLLILTSKSSRTIFILLHSI